MNMIIVHPFVAFMVLYLIFSFGVIIGFIRKGQMDQSDKEPKNSKDRVFNIIYQRIMNEYIGKNEQQK